MEKRETSVEIIVANGLFPLAISENNGSLYQEVDWSKITFNIKQFNNKNPLGNMLEDAVNLIEKCKESNKEGGDDKGITLPINETNNATIDLSIRYLPMNYKLEPSESIEIQNAENLVGVDRFGTSDPYLLFLKNDEKIYRTKAIKKNLNIYDEECGVLDLANIPIFEAVERKIPLIINSNNNKNNNNNTVSSSAGSMNLRLRFEPQMISKKRISSETFMTDTKTLTGVISGGGESVIKSGAFIVGTRANIVGSGVNLMSLGAGSGVSGFGGMLKMNDNTTATRKVSSPSVLTNTPRSSSTETTSHFIENIESISRPKLTGDLILTLIEAKN
ncbi:hypothetical protein Glove_275g56 [Diversispora epigaea]|uniref:C2 domain-containing protein n=1 Tax=Diversispora epigaea TaxID=1348612 RepID=A0A397I540_9GLOM|nr:hypothetical protein Glove_275g56 [Diversispora epigaea]